MPELSPVEASLLVDELRKSLLYQTPTPVENPDGSLRYLAVKIPPACYATIMQVIEAAGGWDPPITARLAAMVKHDRVVKDTLAASDGESYTFRDWEYGDLVTAKNELAQVGDVPELRGIRRALSEEMARRTQGT